MTSKPFMLADVIDTAVCFVQPCNNAAYAKKVCRRHYDEMRRGGDWIRNIIDGDYKAGAGKIVCEICKQPVRDHDMKPCPEAGVSSFLFGDGIKADSVRRRAYRRRRR